MAKSFFGLDLERRSKHIEEGKQPNSRCRSKPSRETLSEQEDEDEDDEDEDEDEDEEEESSREKREKHSLFLANPNLLRKP
jgi:chromatin remodeling complex protein RSC6